MSSSCSSDSVEDEVADALGSAVHEAMAMLRAEMEASSSRRRRRHRRYVNRDREAAHERLHRDYFADNCVYPLTTSDEGTVCCTIWDTTSPMV